MFQFCRVIYKAHTAFVFQFFTGVAFDDLGAMWSKRENAKYIYGKAAADA